MSTEKDIRQFIHYYLGCEVLNWEGIVRLVSVGQLGNPEQKFRTLLGGMSVTQPWKPENKLLLSKLEDMAEEDAIELVKLSKWKQYGNHPHNRVYTTHKNPFGQIVVSWGEGLREKNVPASKEVFSPEEFNFLIKKGYWLFGNDWFDEGIIIDRKTLNNG